MKFKYSAIGRNTPENREHLEKIGYKLLSSSKNNLSPFLHTMRNGEVAGVSNKGHLAIECRYSDELFQAVTAIRDDSDYMQWFVTDYDSRYLCKDEFSWNLDKTAWHKATLSELTEYYKKTED